MARTATVSEEQVAAVANGLLALGIAPTIRGVREKLGSGSMATVLKHYQTWQSKQARPTPIACTLPRDLERILLDFLGREVAASKGVVESELAAMQQANGDLIAESERQALTIDELTAELQEQSGEASRIAGRLVQVEADLASARTEFQAEREAARLAVETTSSDSRSIEPAANRTPRSGTTAFAGHCSASPPRPAGSGNANDPGSTARYARAARATAPGRAGDDC